MLRQVCYENGKGKVVPSRIRIGARKEVSKQSLLMPANLTLDVLAVRLANRKTIGSNELYHFCILTFKLSRMKRLRVP